MEKIRGAIEKSTAIRQMIGNPTIQKGEKMRMVNDLLARQNYPQVIGNFFASLVENGRLDQTVKIMGCFEELVRAHKGIVEVRITTAKVRMGIWEYLIVSHRNCLMRLMSASRARFKRNLSNPIRRSKLHKQ